MEKNKENAVAEFENVIKNSWTYDRMTEEEKNSLWEKMGDFVRQGHVSGSFDQRWRTLQAMYGMFLAGLGNVNNPNWRDHEDKAPEGSFEGQCRSGQLYS